MFLCLGFKLQLPISSIKSIMFSQIYCGLFHIYYMINFDKQFYSSSGSLNTKTTSTSLDLSSAEQLTHSKETIESLSHQVVYFSAGRSGD